MGTRPKTEGECLGTIYLTDMFADEFGTVRLEEWPEGLVLWVGGEIRWRSWRDPALWATREPQQ